MDIARLAAPEVDRVVLSVNGRLAMEHGDRLLTLARGRGLESMDLIPQLAPFMLGGRLTRDLAGLRMRYLPQERVLGRIDELEALGFLVSDDGELGPNPDLRALLQELQTALAQAAEGQWEDHAEEVEQASATARRIGDAASGEHLVAVVHRELPEPDDPRLRLHQRLVTLRFVRQHDHAMAWLSRGLTAVGMVALTELWHGRPVDSDDDLTTLAEDGYIEGEPTRLTDRGRQVRDEIEAETNRSNQESFDVLDDAEAESFVSVLGRLPGVID